MRGQVHARKRKRASRAGELSRTARHNTIALVCFICILLVLLFILALGRVSSGQLILPGCILLLLLVVLAVSWLLRRERVAGGRSEGVRWQRERSVAPQPVARIPRGPLTATDLMQLTPGEFEDFVGDLLAATGRWSDIHRIGGAGDRGADLLAKDRFGRPFIVQCKHYHAGHKVNAGEIRNFLGAKSIYGADECLFVTTSTFTVAARKNMEHLRHTVFLWDGEKLGQLVQEYWHLLPERWKGRR